MPSLDPVPAIRRLDTDRKDLFAIEVAGHVSPADVENFHGLLEGAYALSDQIDLFLRVVDHDGLDWAETDRDTIAEARDHARRHIRRCAAVGDGDAILATLRIIKLSREDVRVFAPEEEDAAWAWIEAEPGA